MSLVLAAAMVISFGLIIPAGAATVEQAQEVNVNDIEKITVSAPMNYDALVKTFAEDNGISYQAAENELAEVNSAQFTYRVLSVTLNVTPEYKPQLKFYCETSEGGHFWGIQSIFSVQLYREYNGITKQFVGDIQVFLRSAYQIQYIINGDFFNNATIGSSSDAQMSVGIGGSFSFSVSGGAESSSNHYKYFFYDDIVAFQS